MSNNISVLTNSSGELVVDSRIVATELDINHKSFLQTIRKHQTQLEQAFGVLAFKTAKPQDSTGGRPETFALLTEPQAIALMTFSRNTERVVRCKIELVKAFESAKAQLVTPTVECRRLPQRDAIDYIEAASKLTTLNVNGQLKQLLEDALVDDLSLGKTNLALKPAEKEYTVVKVRARELGYGVKEIGNGTALGKFVASRLNHVFKKRIGDYDVKHYEITHEFDEIIHEYFRRFKLVK